MDDYVFFLFQKKWMIMFYDLFLLIYFDYFLVTKVAWKKIRKKEMGPKRINLSSIFRPKLEDWVLLLTDFGHFIM